MAVVISIPEGQKLYRVTSREVLVYNSYVFAENGKEAKAKLKSLQENTSDYNGYECVENEETVYEETDPYTIEHLAEWDVEDVELSEGWEEDMDDEDEDEGEEEV